MDMRNYCRAMKANRATISRDSPDEIDFVRQTVGHLTERINGQGGVWLTNADIEKGVMDMYGGIGVGMAHASKHRTTTPEEDLRGLALHLQMLTQDFGTDDGKILHYAHITPKEGNIEILDRAMHTLAYDLFELDNGYEVRMREAGMSARDVLTGRLGFPRLWSLLA